MIAVYIISGLGILSLIAEIANLKRWLLPVAVTGLLVAAGLAAAEWNTSQAYFHDMLRFDNQALAFSIIISLAGLLWFLMSVRYLHERTDVSDHTALIMFSLVGAVFMVSYHNMVMLFLGIEILSVSLYVLAGSRVRDILSGEAAIKYLIMGSFATGFLLLGIALIYGSTGSFDLAGIGDAMALGGGRFPAYAYAGVLLMLVGLAFKLSAVPFHFWAPDVYQGSPLVVTGFMLTVVKAAAIGAFFRLFSLAFSQVPSQWLDVVQVITILTLVVGNVTALLQQNVKRMFAYSGIAHAGYLLIALVAPGTNGASAIGYYVGAYVVATLAAFSVLQCVSDDDHPAAIRTFNGLGSRNPFLAFVMTVSLLSLAGMPPLAGFFGKYLVFSNAIGEGYIGLVLTAVTASLVGVYYYFQLIIAMYFRPAIDPPVVVPRGQIALMIAVTALTLLLGLMPDLVLW
jgi:NADH-quinone oxidoreductase subunit N